MTNSIIVITGGKSGLGNELIKIYRKETNIISIDKFYKKNSVELFGKFKIFKIKSDTSDKKLVLKLNKIINKKYTLKKFFNVAGVGKKEIFLKSCNFQNLDIINTNIVSIVTLSKYAIHKMKGKGGLLINIGSSASFFPLEKFALYSSSKKFIDYFTKILQFENEYKNIKIKLVHPSGFKSQFQNKAKVSQYKKRLMPVSFVAKQIYKKINQTNEIIFIGLSCLLMNFLSSYLPYSINKIIFKILVKKFT